jgi:hypothetical protein
VRIQTRQIQDLDLDPGSESGMGEKSGSGMNIPDHTFESLQIFGVKNGKILIYTVYVFQARRPRFFLQVFVDADPRSFRFWILDGKIRIRDPE